VRGEARSRAVDGQTLLIKARDLGPSKGRVGDGRGCRGIVKASLSDIKPGYRSPRHREPQARESEGSRCIFFPKRSGNGEVHRPWDLGSQSTMTNANVSRCRRDRWTDAT